jgi:5'-deoxynucleotidase YfbR-like HD superfamily hydrolase
MITYLIKRNTITAETIRFVKYIHEKYPQVHADELLYIWHELEKTPLDTSDITTDLTKKCMYNGSNRRAPRENR